MVQILLRVFGGRISLVFCSLSRVEIGWIDDGSLGTTSNVDNGNYILDEDTMLFVCGISSSHFRDTAVCK